MQPCPPTKAITFDVGGTLIEPWPSVGEVYAEVATQHGASNLDVTVLNRRFASAWKAHPKFNYMIEDWSAIVDQTFAGLITEKPSKTFFPDLYQRFAQANAWRIYDEVPQTLTTLKGQGIRLGIVSNWDDRLRPLLNSLGLAGHFETIAVSCEVGASKPSPKPFEVAVKAFNLAPSEILHVGDSFEMDVAGARGAGLQAIQIVRGNQPASPGQIRSLHELVGLVSAE